MDQKCEVRTGKEKHEGKWWKNKDLWVAHMISHRNSHPVYSAAVFKIFQYSSGNEWYPLGI